MAVSTKGKARRARSNVIHIACLNIVLQPHSAEKYVDFLKTIHKRNLDSKVRGDDALMLGSFYEVVSEANAQNNEDVYAGNIYKYLKLDQAEDWFNTLKMDSASRADVKEISIPEHLKPHFKKFQFVFFPKNHRLYFVASRSGDSLSPHLVKRFFDNIASNSSLAKFGEISVTVQPEPGITDEFFGIKRIQRIHLEITKPNPDDHGNLDDEILERLSELNAGKEVREYQEANSSGLQPDDRLKALASVAAENGEVLVKGRTDGNVVELSSKDRPIKASIRFNPDIQTELNALLEKAREMHREFTKRIRRSR